jgi:hypothetical protein
VKLIKQAQSVKHNQPKALMFLSRVVKATKLKSEAMEWSCWGNFYPRSSRVQIGHSPKTSDCRLFGTSSYSGNLGGQSASYSGKDYSQLLKEIMGTIT